MSGEEPKVSLMRHKSPTQGTERFQPLQVPFPWTKGHFRAGAHPSSRHSPSPTPHSRDGAHPPSKHSPSPPHSRAGAHPPSRHSPSHTPGLGHIHPPGTAHPPHTPGLGHIHPPGTAHPTLQGWGTSILQAQPIPHSRAGAHPPSRHSPSHTSGLGHIHPPGTAHPTLQGWGTSILQAQPIPHPTLQGWGTSTLQAQPIPSHTPGLGHIHPPGTAHPIPHSRAGAHPPSRHSPSPPHSRAGAHPPSRHSPSGVSQVTPNPHRCLCPAHSRHSRCQTEAVPASNIDIKKFCPLLQKLCKEATTKEASLKIPDWDFGLFHAFRENLHHQEDQLQRINRTSLGPTEW
ncbi:uncharacterized protein [Aphelocoma coerulescens]|uniref:uncharacterized protein n=1 Tax=Aphelocoma coerulescens TaxID=39617 RepID=UPI0036047815